MNSLEQSCYDILHKNMEHKDQIIYMLYDIESPLANILSSAFLQILPTTSVAREFIKPPQPLYRGGLINPENPHIKEQNRLITSHNIEENKRIWLDHHIRIETESSDSENPQIESIKNELMTLPKGSIVVLIQSTNFRLSTFRIRLELFHRGVHVVEFNHLAYIPESQFDTFQDALIYRTDMYTELEDKFRKLFLWAKETKIFSTNGSCLTFSSVEPIRWNTWNYRGIENKWGTFPIWEIFTESLDLSLVNGKCLIEAFPNEDFSVNNCEPFEIVIESWRVLPSEDFPAEFAKLYNWIVQYEWEVLVRELWLWLNPSISKDTPLADINFHERKLWVHLSLGKKHGIYGKKLPKSELQRFHIDVFLSLKDFHIDERSVFDWFQWSL